MHQCIRCRYRREFKLTGETRAYCVSATKLAEYGVTLAAVSDVNLTNDCDAFIAGSAVAELLPKPKRGRPPKQAKHDDITHRFGLGPSGAPQRE